MDWSELPRHVLRYLEDNEVDPNDLPDEVIETLAGLSLGEVALLKVVGETLRRNMDDTEHDRDGPLARRCEGPRSPNDRGRGSAAGRDDTQRSPSAKDRPRDRAVRGIVPHARDASAGCRALACVPDDPARNHPCHGPADRGGSDARGRADERRPRRRRPGAVSGGARRGGEGHDERCSTTSSCSASTVQRCETVCRLQPVASLVGSQYYWIHHHHPIAFLGSSR